jgi:nitrogen fixation/metabolism regulation signal transduction histidine kinase
MDALIGVYNGMIDQLRAERTRLEEHFLLMDKILVLSPAGIIILGLEERIEVMNPAAERLLRLERDSARGSPLSALQGSLVETLRTLEESESRVALLRGGRRVRCRRTTFIDRGTERSFFLLEELTEELRASEKAAYGKLIRTLSHEVNNSLGAVGSLLESCRNYGDQLRSDDRLDFETALDVASRRLRHLDRFMNSFADVVRLPDPSPQLSRLDAIATDVVTLFGPELAQRSIECDLFVEHQPFEVHADPHQLEQVLVNVVRNAIEAIDRDGRVCVVLGVDEGVPCLRVSDTGGGIAADVQARLFTPFFSTKPDGRGLGLTIVREILDRHGFAFSLDNDGEGAEFRIELDAKHASRHPPSS